jgi:putative endonuclease
MNQKQTIGRFGEDLACDFLIKRGYTLIARNVKTSYKEIDIIATYKNLTVFVEVKTRSNPRLGLAEDALSRVKIRNFKQAVMFYCNKKFIDYNMIRLDFVAIDVNRPNKTAKIKHFKNVV